MSKVACSGFAMKHSKSTSGIGITVEKMEELALRAEAKITRRNASFTANSLKP